MQAVDAPGGVPVGLRAGRPGRPATRFSVMPTTAAVRRPPAQPLHGQTVGEQQVVHGRDGGRGSVRPGACAPAP